MGKRRDQTSTNAPADEVDPVDLLQVDPVDLASVQAVDGVRTVTVRCRVPVRWNAPAGAFRFATRETANRDVPVAGDPAAAAAGEQAADSQDVLDRIEGPASSTSQDWYGTAMTRDCLEDMAVQFRAGVDYLPRHHSWMASVEWYEQIGETVDAQVARGQVAEPPDGESPSEQYVLTVTTDLYDTPISQTLVSRIRSGRPPGQSIGGWFREIQVSYDEDGCVMYPIRVLRVELDHLAAVRSPANPDADRVWLALSRALESAGRPGQAAGATVPNPDQGASAPAPESVPAGRSTEDHMPLTKDELDALAEMMRSTMAAGLAPLTADVAALKQHSAAPPNPVVPAPAPDPVAEALAARAAADAELAATRARLQAAEAELTARRAEPQRQGATAPSWAGAANPGANPAQPEVPAAFRCRDGSDIREIAPLACQIFVRTGGDVALTPGLVFQKDGLGAVSALARASGEVRHVATYLSREDKVRGGPSDLLSEDVVKPGSKLRQVGTTTRQLRDLLAGVIMHADADGFLTDGLASLRAA